MCVVYHDILYIQRINMLTTVFKRWDEQYTILPNQQLAKREIRNQRRSGNAVVVMPLLIALSTPKVCMQQYIHLISPLLYNSTRCGAVKLSPRRMYESHS
jgi:Mechanosensitive ion channel